MKANTILILASFAVLVVSFWNRNNLPGQIDYVAGIADEPLQTPTDEEPFDVHFNDVDYHVEPEFAYDLTGMVVSYRHHDYKSGIHMRANDHLNMVDLCVVWGDNTVGENLYEFDFSNGIFTCFFNTRDQQAWEAFNGDQLSNNHLLSDDTFIRDQVKKVRIGDQVRFRGYLASYSNDTAGKRGTSTTRTDTGDGACETVYVEHFRILRAATSYWRISMWSALPLLLIGLVIHFRRPYRPH